MSALFNLASLALGLSAWVFAITAIIKKDLHGFTVFSFTCCVLSLIFQIIEIYHRVSISDFSAIMDTIGAIVFVSSVMSGVTIILNLASFIIAGRKINMSNKHKY